MTRYQIIQTSVQSIVPSYTSENISYSIYSDPLFNHVEVSYSGVEVFESSSLESSSQESYSKKTSSSSKFLADTADEILLPLNILKNNSSLEAIVLYLKDVKNLNYSQIAVLLNRDPRTIWITYSNSRKKKLSLNLNSDGSYDSTTRKLASFKILLPIKIFESRKFSVLESIVLYLKTSHALSFNQIAALLGKNYRTIWTVYRRALIKLDSYDDMSKKNISKKIASEKDYFDFKITRKE